VRCPHTIEIRREERGERREGRSDRVEKCSSGFKSHKQTCAVTAMFLPPLLFL